MPAEAMYCMALQYLAERFNAYLTENPAYEHGILIADERLKRLDFNVAQSYLSCIFGNVDGRSLTRLLEGPLFADSRLTAGLQIADNIGAALFANYCYYYCRDLEGVPDYSHISERYWPKLDAMQFKSRRQYGDYDLFGYGICDHRDYL